MISFFSHAAADNLRLARSRVIESPDDGVYGLIRLPRYAFLVDAWVHLITPYTTGATGSISFGIRGNGSATIPADSVIIPDVAGWTNLRIGAKSVAHGYWLDEGSGAFIATFDIGDSSANCKLIAFAQYSILH